MTCKDCKHYVDCQNEYGDTDYLDTAYDEFTEHRVEKFCLSFREVT